MLTPLLTLTVAALQTAVRLECQKVLDPALPYRDQHPASITAVIDKVCAQDSLNEKPFCNTCFLQLNEDYPVLRRCSNDWAAYEMIKQYWQNKRGGAG